MVVAAALVTLFFWFGVPTITNGKPDIAGQLALKSPRECTSNKVVCTLDRYRNLLYLPIELAALVAAGLAVLRRNRTVLTLAGMVVLWVATEIAFVLHGFPGVQRYLFEAAGLTGVLAGVGTGWLLLDARHWVPAVPRWAGIPFAAAFIILCLPHAKALADREHRDIVEQRNRTERILQLGSYINALGGASRIQACGGALLNVEYVSIAGWYLHKNTGQVAYQPNKVLKRFNPVVYFVLLPNGWMAAAAAAPERHGRRLCVAEVAVRPHRASSSGRPHPQVRVKAILPSARTSGAEPASHSTSLESGPHAPTDQIRGLSRPSPRTAPAGGGRPSGRARILPRVLAPLRRRLQARATSATRACWTRDDRRRRWS